MMIVFSDLDGSLLDHDTYDWQPASQALAVLKDRDFPLVLVSSKTLAELAGFREQLGLEHPVVAENGAAMDIPAGYFPGAANFSAETTTRAQLQSAYQAVKRSNGFRCEAFYELGVPGIVRETGLSKQQAMLANDRTASEPILWLDNDDSKARFCEEMASRGLRCVHGGRFLHLMGDTGKEETVRELLQAYTVKWPDSALVSVSLGDAPNDLGMLAATDVAVIIPGRHRHPMTLEAHNRVLRPASSGPAGWNEAMMSLLAEQHDSLQSAHNNGD